MAAGPLSGLSILIAEDEYLIAMDVEQICLDAGAAATLIASGPEQLRDAVAGRQKIDAAILDLRLGGHSTLPAAETLAVRGIPFIFATGRVDSGEPGQRFAGIAVVAKPYSGEELVAALAAAVRVRSGEDR